MIFLLAKFYLKVNITEMAQQFSWIKYYKATANFISFKAQETCEGHTLLL